MSPLSTIINTLRSEGWSRQGENKEMMERGLDEEMQWKGSNRTNDIITWSQRSRNVEAGAQQTDQKKH